ncbi:MAG: DUF1565 domain-containing protein [Rivularia sp. ALOHA_DT_140]|nr:DUF1565 domain-containing protein [Rivularia sp. ALOHA_DT_140]
MRTSSKSSVLLITATVASLTTTFLSAGSNIAVAKISPMSEEKTKRENLISQVNVLFVNPSIGNDQQANGSENAPFKTISQALTIAKDNTVIRLTPGTYKTSCKNILWYDDGLFRFYFLAFKIIRSRQFFC